MDEAELGRRAGLENIPSGILEKDYVLSVMLIHLGKIDILDYLVFKGGTAIKKIYYPEARFSEDLDFNFYQIDGEKIFKKINKNLDQEITDSVEFTKTKDFNQSNTGLNFRVGYIGPLNHENSIKIDLSGREKLLEPKTVSQILHDYPDLSKTEDVNIPTMSRRGILSEKCRALMMRAESKDLYDIWYLTKQGVEFDIDMVKEKHTGYEENWDEKCFENRLKELKNTWNRDLMSFLNEVPEFEQVRKDLKKILTFE